MAWSCSLALTHWSSCVATRSLQCSLASWYDRLGDKGGGGVFTLGRALVLGWITRNNLKKGDERARDSSPVCFELLGAFGLLSFEIQKS